MTATIIKGSPEHKQQAVAKIIVPGRRALGEDWRQITFRPDPVSGDVVIDENVETERPAGGRAIVIPAMANLSDEEINFIMGGALKAQEYRTRSGNVRPVTDAEIKAMVNAMWDSFVAQKLAWFKGQTTIGAGGFFQREKVATK